jgi:3-oxoacyl-[acyl-carrier-protein] synthase II
LVEGKTVAGHFLERTQCGHGEALLEQLFRPEAGVSSYLSACAASTQAIGKAFYDLKLGRSLVCLVGGADSRLHPEGILGYDKLGALATGFEKNPEKACRPFDRQRRGFVIGEGAGFLVMETLSGALRRGVPILAEVLASATTTDAYRLTDPEPEGVMAARCILDCLRTAGLGAADLDYIQAHGTGTLSNDRAEAAAIRLALGEQADRIPVSSLKPYLGHASMAAGALETVASVLMFKKGLMPPCLNLDEPEEGLNLHFIRAGGVYREVKTLLKNSFGFGGQNACVILRNQTFD